MFEKIKLFVELNKKAIVKTAIIVTGAVVGVVVVAALTRADAFGEILDNVVLVDVVEENL
jgi:hypothetical protein